LYAVGHAIFGVIYRVTATGVEHLPKGGFLLLPNHISFVDAIVLLLACPRKIRFIIDEAYYRHRILHPFLRLAGCIPITPRKAKEAMRAAADRIRAGEIVCLFPEGSFHAQARCCGCDAAMN
jgi:acyl-[acyl-carrier-protein]-phospholipid O-acyltransferase/long-chain-fatty-acid--[acyl-carrier-protein] ligase